MGGRRVETTRELAEVREFAPSMYTCAYVCICRVHCGCSLPPYLDTTGAQCVLLLPFRIPCPPLLPCTLLPLVPFHIHPFQPHWRFTSFVRLVSPHLARSLALSIPPLSLSQSLFPPRRPRSRCNERYTLSSSCSRRRCFHSAAQSVSARLPVRFVQGEMCVRTDARRTSVTHESKRTWRRSSCLRAIISFIYHYNVINTCYIRYSRRINLPVTLFLLV